MVALNAAAAAVVAVCALCDGVAAFNALNTGKAPLPTAAASTSSWPILQLHHGVAKSIASAAAALSIGLGALLQHPAPVLALNEQQQVVAEVWRAVDRLYLDRSFNGVDWFDLRQKTIAKVASPMSETELNKVIADMLSQLGDKYTRYLPPAKYETIVQSASGQLAGVGVQISLEGDYPVVVDVEEGTPAAAAGLKAGDLLVQASGEDLRGYTPDDTAALLRGPEGSRVGVVAKRGGTQTLDLVLTRARFKIQGVRGARATLSNGSSSGAPVAVVRVKSFSATTAEDVAAALRVARAAGPIGGAVLDLRGNVGGLLPGGVDTARLFLPAQRDIVFVVGKTGVVAAQGTGVEEGAEVSVPLAVLVDGRTASASEVLSAALQENGRAKLVGTKTFGKGVIQTVEPLSGGAGVAVTVARYETPQRHDINGRGIPVDVEAACAPEQPAQDCVPAAALAR